MKNKLQAKLISVLFFLILLLLIINPFFNFGVNFWDRPNLFYDSGHINTNSREFIIGVVLFITIMIYNLVLKPKNKLKN